MKANRNDELAESFEVVKKELEDMKSEPLRYDTRSLAVALTHLETAKLWFANAIKDNGTVAE